MKDIPLARTVTTQAEFDQAVVDEIRIIKIASPAGVWITVHASDSSTVRAFGSAMVRASGLATVHAFDSSTVHAYDSSTVRAFGSATVRATDSSTVHATDSSTVTAASRVAVHLHSGQARVDGGVLIDHTPEPKNAEEWCAWHDVAVEDGVATLYKAVNDQWTTGRGVDYSPGSTPEAPDWSPDGECGGGLHFSPTPAQAQSYYAGATRYVAVGVLVEELSPILGGIPKAKARRVVVPCREVDIDMKEIIHD